MEARRDVFQAIADPTRRDILVMIARDAMNLNAIADKFDVSRPAVSQHVRVLEECGLIEITKSGRERYCRTRPEKMYEVAEWIQPFKEIWEKRFNGLDQLLEKLNANPKKNKK